MPAAGRAAQSVPPVLTGKALTRLTVLTPTWLKSHREWRLGRITGAHRSTRYPCTSRYICSPPIWLNTCVMTTAAGHFNQFTLRVYAYLCSPFDYEIDEIQTPSTEHGNISSSNIVMITNLCQPIILQVFYSSQKDQRIFPQAFVRC